MEHCNFLCLASQSINISAFRSLNGNDRSAPVSFSHLDSMTFADLYVLHVPFVMARFPYFATDSATSVGNFSSLKSSAAQPPLVPYLVSPLKGVGWNLPLPANCMAYYCWFCYVLH